MSETSFLSELSLYDINLYLQLDYKTENTGQASTTLFNMTDEPSPDCFLWPPAFGCSPAISGVHGRYVQRKKRRFVPLSNQITEAFFPQILVKTLTPAAFEK